MVELAIFILTDHARDVKQCQHLVNTFKIENLYKMHEDFLDDVFGAESKLDKQEFIDKVIQKAKWILKPDQIR
jgi:hypothetical protein